MKLKRIQLDGKPAVAVNRRDQWVPIPIATAAAGADPGIPGNIADDIVALLGTDTDFRQRLYSCIDDFLASGGSIGPAQDDTPIMPFHPKSYRDFMLFEQHVIGASRGFAKRFMPNAFRVAALYERVFKKPFPKFRPAGIWYEKPIYYMGNHLSFFTEGHEVAFPSYSRALDYELEIGAVIVKSIKNATPEEALSAVGGFVVFNDFSARDVQLPEMRSGFGPVKAKHFANAISHVVVSADEVLPLIENLKGEVWINGERIVETSTAGMQHSLGAAVAYASLEEQLHPGELIGTGTLPGGCGMENGRWLQPGDTITLKVDRIGTLTNTVRPN